MSGSTKPQHHGSVADFRQFADFDDDDILDDDGGGFSNRPWNQQRKFGRKKLFYDFLLLIHIVQCNA